MTKQPAPLGFVSAFADLQGGMLLAAPEDLAADSRLEGLAAAAPELLSGDRAAWELIFGRLQRGEEAHSFQDIVLVSRDRIHVAMRCASDPNIALVGVAPRDRSVGLVVAEARERLARRLDQR